MSNILNNFTNSEDKELDYLFLEKPRLDKESKYGFLFMVGLILYAYINVLFNFGKIGCICLAIFWVLFLIKMFIFMWKNRKFRIIFNKHLEKVPVKVQLNALKLYGGNNFTETMLSAIECHEGHIGGECPLCGAE